MKKLTVCIIGLVCALLGWGVGYLEFAQVNPAPPEPTNMYDIDYPEEISLISISSSKPDTFTMYRVDGTNRLILGYANEANKPKIESIDCGCPN